MNEVDEAAKVITAQADPDAQIIFGAAIDEKLIDQVKVTVIATGFNETRRKFVSLATEDGQIQTESPEATGEQKDQIDEDEFDIPTFLRQIR